MKTKATQQWLLVLHVLASFFFFFILLTSSSSQELADSSDPVKNATRIDCGVIKGSGDEKTPSDYQYDDGFVEHGKGLNLSSNYNKEEIGNQLRTLRSFPEGKRNCYRVPTERNAYYLVRAFFAYGNYDSKTSFDLYIGVNYWATISKEDGDIVRHEVIHFSPTDDINVCLVKTDDGIPFISLLEVWPWQNSRYDQLASSLLRLMSRSKLGMSEDDTTSDDNYGRSWFNRKMDNSVRISSSSAAIDSNTSDNVYDLPKEVLTSAVQSIHASSSLVIHMDRCCNTGHDYYVYLHFYDS
ncbi:putative leucine-rich repeat receptor-like serine/threonine-protein kinase At2g19230 [Prosopis cineraria]|uniref:putative leucine-rich repeat receptor-like serine/threonine-protein kinase At2g19230 n=1 Tax=Prosopis cineraria TaxID=364024 RepID=UPI00240F9A2F|nr:putative leucine-rich repeat receptor-like serine/threonine-protein kinase At2g19230 [Prosopis cineraria]